MYNPENERPRWKEYFKKSDGTYVYPSPIPKTQDDSIDKMVDALIETLGNKIANTNRIKNTFVFNRLWEVINGS